MHVLPSLDLNGGTARRVRDHIESSSLEHSILLHDCWMDRDREAELARADPRVLSPVCFGPRDWLRATARLVRIRGPVVLVTYFPKGHAYAAALARSGLFRHVVSLPGLDPLATARRRWLFRRALSLADFAFANSERTAEHYRAVRPSRPIATVYNPVSRYRDLYTAEPRRLALLSCGGLAPVKEYERVLEVCAHWSRHGVEHTYEMVGDGPLRGAFERFVAQNGLAGVRLRGYLDLPSVLEPHHVFVHPCDREGFGLAPVEAALSGVPVVLARGAGAAEVLRDVRHVHLLDFRREPRLVAREIEDFVSRVRVDERQVAELRARLGRSRYSDTVDAAICACARPPSARWRRAA